jgi:hypothetical protein
VHVTEILNLAADDITADTTSPAGLTLAEARAYLDADEWELALDVLAVLDGGTARFWELWRRPQTRCTWNALAGGATRADTKASTA